MLFCRRRAADVGWLTTTTTSTPFPLLSRAILQEMSGGVNQRCVSAQPPGSEWKCFMAATTLPYIQTPLFIFNSLVDAWQMMAILALPCCASPYNKVGWCNITACPPAAQAAYASYRNDMVTSLQPAIASSTHGLWTETCCLHGMATWQPTWMESQAEGQVCVIHGWCMYVCVTC
jgi:hypothetical protein